MGYAVVAMFGSVFELIARTCVAFFLVRPFGFIGACASLPMAWCSALLLVIPMYFYQIRRMEKQQAEANQK
jgi:Na+-driven multidrug efflux pump